MGKDIFNQSFKDYRERHRDIKQRQKQKKDVENIESKNIIFRHNYTESMDLSFKCSLEGCDEKFTIRIFPKQYVYPRFCMEHRNDFKRENFIRIMSKKSSD